MPPSFLDTPPYPNTLATRRNITHGLPLLTTPGAPRLTLASGASQELPGRSSAFKRNYGPNLDNRFDGFASNVLPKPPKSSLESVCPQPVVNPGPSYPRMLTR
ncbi:hypothetical protein DAKH74_038180 [Maudiozyma humilis]|uniref:Uncharacterized protein n=1 Tax=Maudiozyma humilis TaxID=51915 RepID=A0AAV5S2M8_MAUHU|nr:hypothetical protein DAKH74_038180 [Kazachstania humilis]